MWVDDTEEMTITKVLVDFCFFYQKGIVNEQ